MLFPHQLVLSSWWWCIDNALAPTVSLLTRLQCIPENVHNHVLWHIMVVYTMYLVRIHYSINMHTLLHRVMFIDRHKMLWWKVFSFYQQLWCNSYNVFLLFSVREHGSVSLEGWPENKMAATMQVLAFKRWYFIWWWILRVWRQLDLLSGVAPTQQWH